MKKILKKALSLLLLCIAVLGAFSACTVERAYPGAPEGMRPCNEGAEGVILYVPTAWSVDYSTGIPTAYFSFTDTTMINMVTVPKETVGDKTIPAYFGEYEESFKNTVKDFTLIPHTEELPYEELKNKNDLTMYVYMYSFKITKSENNLVTYKFSQAFFRTNEPDSDLYIITYGTTLDKFDTHLEDYTEALANAKPVNEPVSMGEDAPIKPEFTTENAPDGYSALTAEYVDYILYVPSSWTPLINTGITSACKTDNKAVSASVTAFNPTNNDNVYDGTDYDSFFAASEALIKESFGNITFADESNKYVKVEFASMTDTASDTAARKYTYTVASGGTSYTYEQYIVLKDGYFYVLTLTCPSAVYDESKAAFDGIASNFKFKQ